MIGHHEAWRLFICCNALEFSILISQNTHAIRQSYNQEIPPNLFIFNNFMRELIIIRLSRIFFVSLQL